MMERPPNSPAFVSRPLPVVAPPRPLAHSPPLTLAPRLRTLYQARILARILPSHPHLHALTLTDLAREWGIDRLSLGSRLVGTLEISGQDLLFISDELGCTPHELMAGILAYRTPKERASSKAKNMAQSRARYSKVKAARIASRERDARYTATGRRAPVHTILMERLPANERSPLPPTPKKEPHAKT